MSAVTMLVSLDRTPLADTDAGRGIRYSDNAASAVVVYLRAVEPLRRTTSPIGIVLRVPSERRWVARTLTGDAILDILPGRTRSDVVRDLVAWAEGEVAA